MRQRMEFALLLAVAVFALAAQLGSVRSLIWP